MKLRSKAVWSLSAIFCLLTLLPATVAAQGATSGSLTGVITDAQGGVLPAASVVATHTPTGTTYETTADVQGRYNLLNIRVGPYDITFTMGGFKPETQQGVEVRLSEQKAVDVRLQLETVAETIEVIGHDLDHRQLARRAPPTTFRSRSVENLPTISRNLVDIARTSPYFNPMGLNTDPLALSVAGRNNRYNNVQIDGAVNNDVFGLAASGTPGGQTEAQPISLDAIQELQLVVSPYDVRQGGFSGGGINAITKSGSNQFHGTAYFFGRNQDWVGEEPDGHEDRRLQGSAVRRQPRRTASSRTRRSSSATSTGAASDNPSGISVGRHAVSSSATSSRDRPVPQHPAEPLRLRSRNATTSSSGRSITTRFFVRTDFNLGQSHQLAVRHNYLDAQNDIGRPNLTDLLHAGLLLPVHGQDEFHVSSS